MQFLSLMLPTADPVALARWYAQTLGLPLRATTLRVGATNLSFVASETPTAPLHLAFHVPPRRLPQAVEWFAERVELWHQAEQFVVRFADWGASSAYFRDPAGNLLEVIAHDRLNRRFRLPALPSITGLAEVGLVVAEPLAAAQALAAELGVPRFHATDDPNFQVIGDHQARLVLVAPARPWFGAEALLAQPATLHLTTATHQLTVQADGQLNLLPSADPTAAPWFWPPAVQAGVKPAMSDSSVVAQTQRAAIRAAAEGLFWPSESDYPLQFVDLEPQTPASIAAALGLPAAEPLEQRPLDAPFRYLLAPANSDATSAARFQALHAALAALNDPQVYRFGTIEISLVMLGTAADGRLIGIQTTVIES